MQAAPARYVSVSELYSTDEVELLLDEIRELEPTSCRGEDVQDFEIAGSGCGGLGGAGGGGGRSPAGTDFTERSWDSHAHYSARVPGPPLALAPLYCAWRQALTARGALAAALVACGAGACACAWAAAGLRVALPLAWRLRLLLLGALSSLLLHAALLVAHTTLLTRLLPIDWNKLGMCSSAWSAISMLSGGGLTLHAVLAAPEYKYAPKYMADLLYSAAGLSLIGGLAAVVLGVVLWRAWVVERAHAPYSAVPVAPAHSHSHAHAHAYLEASTSHDNPL